MAILEDNPQVERIEADGITKAREFVFEDNENIFIPAGTRYHKIITNFLYFDINLSPYKI